MSLHIKIVSTYTYTYPKHFLSVMVFVGLRIFARRMAHVYVAGSTFHSKKRAFLQNFSFSIERSCGEDGSSNRLVDWGQDPERVDPTHFAWIWCYKSAMVPRSFPYPTQYDHASKLYIYALPWSRVVKYNEKKKNNTLLFYYSLFF